MHKTKALLGALALSVAAYSHDAEACGGFFCGRQPVDQTAERILFEVGEDSVTMTTQIAFNGEAPDFAWILPLGEVPDPDSLAVFPQRALTALDANTGPVFVMPDDCQIYFEAAPTLGGVADDSDGGAVTVHIRAEVGDYDVAVIESQDPDALIEWLRGEDFRVTPPMEPYIDLYTEEGMKFLALKLVNGADVSDIKPFRFTLPGNSPSIPLRMTALAAEPEMSILVFLLSDQRYEAKNWENVTIDDSLIRFDPFSYSSPLLTNWTKLVAAGVDEAGGQGWVTEFAGPTDSYAEQVRNQIDAGFFPTPEDEEAATALLGVLEGSPYLTRFYTRLSAEEMTVDPVFGRSSGGDVPREHQLQAVVDGIDQCSVDTPDSTDPCDFATCGAGGICRSVTGEDALGNETEVAACACVPGATARTTFAPDGSATVICQDQRMSFLNPGDNEAGAEVLPDPCATFDCGSHGHCMPVNMTPTCVCDAGFVATGSFSAEGARLTTCVQPAQAIPDSFYDNRLPELPAEMPGGKEVSVPDPDPATGTGGGPDSGSADGSSDGSSGSTDSATGSGGSSGSNMADGSAGGGGCSMSGGPRSAGLGWLALMGLAAAFARRRRA